MAARPVPAWLAALSLVVAGSGWFFFLRTAPAPGQPAARAEQHAICRHRRAVIVRFVLSAPGARTVQLAGDFNKWSTRRTALEDADGDGVWSVQVELAPGRYYEYKYLVDGTRWVLDPGASAQRPDGFGGRNSLLVL